MSVLLGCIADDFTGATDLGSVLVNGGMRAILTIGVPSQKLGGEAEAIVVALKSRTIAAGEAVNESLKALEWLKNAGASKFFFKYCSTFDSTPQGNIGPVMDILSDRLGIEFTIACPAYPKNRRTTYQGCLFVGDTLLNESGMQHHPLTPMTDPNLVRILASQTQHRVGLIPLETVRGGSLHIEKKMTELQSAGFRYAIVDAIEDQDLMTIAEGCSILPLLTGGAGLALGLPQLFRKQGLLPAKAADLSLPVFSGHTIMLSGSCSKTTQQQVQIARKKFPSYKVDPLALNAGDAHLQEILSWMQNLGKEGPVLVYATDEPEAVGKVQAQLGTSRSSSLIEETMGKIARFAVDQMKIKRLVVAGGETSGAVVRTLGVTALQLGPSICPGVPWTATLSNPQIALALKSGNFGGPEFFLKAMETQP